MLARVFFFLLFCCAAQRASSLSATESLSWPWGKSDPVGRAEAVRTATIASYQEDRIRTEAAVRKRKEEAENPKPKQNDTNEFDVNASTAAVKQELEAKWAQEQAHSVKWFSGKSPQPQDPVNSEDGVRTATIASYQEDLIRTEAAVRKRRFEAEKSKQNDTTEKNANPSGAAAKQHLLSNLFEAKRAQDKAHSAKEQLQAEQLKEFAELKELTEAEKADEQAADKAAAKVEQAKALAAEQAARDKQAVQAAEARLAQDQAAEASVQDRAQGFLTEMEAKQQELEKVLKWGAELKAELATKQQQLKEVTDAEQVQEQVAAQANNDVLALKSAEEHDTEQALSAQADAELIANKSKQTVLEENQKIESQKAQLLTMQRNIEEATKSEKAMAQNVQAAEAHATEEVLETKQRDLKAKLRAAEQAEAQSRVEKMRNELETKQRELKVLEKIADDVPENMKQKFDHVRQKREREVHVVTEALGEPAQPGCFVAIPSGCPKLPLSKEMWRKDTWASAQGLDKEKCQRRKGIWDKYCDSEDAEMAFVANKTLSDR